MSGYKIVGFNIVDFKGIEVVKYDWKGDEGLVVVGDHGDGKSNVIEALNVLLEGAKALKKIDNPVHDGAKKYKITAVFKGDGQEDQLACYDIGNLFRITATQSANGKQQLKIENLENGAPIKASVRDILKTLRGLYVDPHQLISDLEQHNGDKKLAATVLKNIGLDLSEFEQKEEEFAIQWSADNEEVERNRKLLESIEIPAEGFPDEKDDIDNLWNESAAYKEFLDRIKDRDNSQKLLQAELKNCTENYNISKNKVHTISSLISVLSSNLTKYLSLQKELILTGKNDLTSIIMDDEDQYDKNHEKLTDSAEIFEEVLKLLTSRTQYYREQIRDNHTDIIRIKEKINAETTNLNCENKSYKENEDKIKEITSKIESYGELEIWEGIKDPTGELTPDQFITQSIQEAQENNILYLKKEEHKNAVKDLKSAEHARDATNKLRKENLEARTQRVASSDFQIDGLSINEKGSLTAKIDGKPVVTLKDLNHADKLRVLSELLMVNNAAPLKLIVIKEGYACKPEYQKIIFDQARKHGHTAIMESFISLEDEGCLYMKDGISSDTPPVDLKKFESDENVSESESIPDW